MCIRTSYLEERDRGVARHRERDTARQRERGVWLGIREGCG